MPARRAPPASDPFTGFAREAPGFFHALAAEMNRAWFAAHRDVYEQQWVAPMTALLGQVRAGLVRTYRGIPLSAPRLFRIHRDVRFGKDKSPYKTHVGGLVSTGEGPAMETGAAIYLQLGLEEYAGAGFYGFTPAQLVRWRRQVAADRPGKQLVALIAAATEAGFGLDAQDVLARVPRGIDPEHPRAGLLRHKGCVLAFPAIPRGLIHRPAFSAWLIEQATRAAPVVRWIQQHVS